MCVFYFSRRIIATVAYISCEASFRVLFGQSFLTIFLKVIANIFDGVRSCNITFVIDSWCNEPIKCNMQLAWMVPTTGTCNLACNLEIYTIFAWHSLVIYSFYIIYIYFASVGFLYYWTIMPWVIFIRSTKFVRGVLASQKMSFLYI